MIKMIGFFINIISEWFKQSTVAKSTVAGMTTGSFMYIALMQLTHQQIAEVSASVDSKVERRVMELDKKVFDYITIKSQMRDEQLKSILREQEYQRNQLNATNDNVLKVLMEIKRK